MSAVVQAGRSCHEAGGMRSYAEWLIWGMGRGPARLPLHQGTLEFSPPWRKPAPSLPRESAKKKRRTV